MAGYTHPPTHTRTLHTTICLFRLFFFVTHTATSQVRHGAALALRELLRSHAWCAAVEVPLDEVPSGWAVPGGAGEAGARGRRRWRDWVGAEVARAGGGNGWGVRWRGQVASAGGGTAAQRLGVWRAVRRCVCASLGV